MLQQDIVSAASGGALIGLAAVTLMLFNGRIAGISGIFAGLLALLRGERPRDLDWRAAFVAGLVLSPFVYIAVAGERPTIEFVRSAPLMAIGGLLVGYGARLGSGCTSGHGVCGVARFSKRSVVATATFMTTAIMTVFAVRQLAGA
jgi:uncharacterized membrane protein YedE/YeeE